jgi:outer membrane autotransporter protein
MSGRSFGVAGLYHFNPEGNYSPFVKLGWNHHSFRVTAPTRDSEGGSGNNEFYGVGIDGKINETIKYRVEFERMNVGEGDDMDNIGAGLLFGF